MALISLLAAVTLLAPTSEAPTKSQIESAAEYHRSYGGFALIVLHEGKVIHEEYAEGRDADQASQLASGTKSFAGVVAVAAQEDGLLRLDEKVCETITEWKDDPRKSQITIRQLLSLSSGLVGGPTGSPQSYAASIADDTFADPGEQFRYGPNPFQVFGELMRRKLKTEGYLDYLKRRILDPIDCTWGRWTIRRGDEPSLPSGASFTVREWVKFGEMIRLDGKVGDKVILKPESVAELFKPGASNSYGLTWWLGGEAGSRDIPGMVMAAGAGKQRLYVMREKGLTVARLAPVAGSGRYSDAEFLTRLTGGE